MLPIIKIKRATGEYERQLVKMAETKFYYLVIYKNIEPIWGGLYAAALLTKQYTEILLMATSCSNYGNRCLRPGELNGAGRTHFNK